MVHDNGKNGMMLHRSCDYATVTNNTAYDNLDAGLAVYESSNLVISHNRFYHNKCEYPAAMHGNRTMVIVLDRAKRFPCDWAS